MLDKLLDCNRQSSGNRQIGTGARSLRPHGAGVDLISTLSAVKTGFCSLHSSAFVHQHSSISIRPQCRGTFETRAQSLFAFEHGIETPWGHLASIVAKLSGGT
jgi:hypothetical protein